MLIRAIAMETAARLEEQTMANAAMKTERGQDVNTTAEPCAPQLAPGAANVPICQPVDMSDSALDWVSS